MPNKEGIVADEEIAKYVANGPESVVGALAMACLQDNFKKNRPLSIPSLNLVLAGKEPPELYTRRLRTDLGRLYDPQTANGEFAAYDTKMVEAEISPATRWLLSYASEGEIQAFLAPLRAEVKDFSKNKGLLTRIEGELSHVLEIEGFPPEIYAWFQVRIDLINRFIAEIKEPENS